MDKGKIVILLAEILEIPVDELMYSTHTPLIDNGLTSLKFISFIVRVEETFGIEIFDSDLLLEKFQTIDDVFETLGKYFSTDHSIKKCLVLDADGVLWKGISGEENVVIDKQVLDFQAALIDLYHRGVLLCICSKNESAFIESSFLHPNMLLKKEHFVDIIANRVDKATNMRAISEKLNLPLDCMVFIDDSDYEIGFVTANFPEIECVKFNYSSHTQIEQVTDIFSNMQVTSNPNRTQLYLEQRAREKEKVKSTSVKEYNASLMTNVVVSRAGVVDCVRLAELSQRTNQFNLSARRYTEEELHSILTNDSYQVFLLAANDKYGDMGIVGMAILKGTIIESFMLSCRVFERDFELVLLNALKEVTGKQIQGIYVATEKNQRYAQFYPENGVDVI